MEQYVPTIYLILPGTLYSSFTLLTRNCFEHLWTMTVLVKDMGWPSKIRPVNHPLK